MNLSDAEVKSLRAAAGEASWNAVCDQIKAARGGKYPADWYARVVLGGLMSEVKSGWPGVK